MHAVENGEHAKGAELIAERKRALRIVETEFNSGVDIAGAAMRSSAMRVPTLTIIDRRRCTTKPGLSLITVTRTSPADKTAIAAPRVLTPSERGFHHRAPTAEPAKHVDCNRPRRIEIEAHSRM